MAAVLGRPEVAKQTALESMNGQINSLETIASDLQKRLKRMEARVNGDHPAEIGAASPKAVPSGIRGQMQETLESVHAILTDCHSVVESLENFA